MTHKVTKHTRITSNPYFRTTEIRYEGEEIGALEYHHAVKNPYWVAWRYDTPSKLVGNKTGRTQMFDDKMEALEWSIGHLGLEIDMKELCDTIG